jgi:hypothetical protein
MPTARAHLFHDAPKRWNVWVSHEKVHKGRWSILLHGLTQRRATEEMVIRADRVRRRGEPCRFRILPEGWEP